MYILAKSSQVLVLSHYLKGTDGGLTIYAIPGSLSSDLANGHIVAHFELSPENPEQPKLDQMEHAQPFSFVQALSHVTEQKFKAIAA
jgi:hypothetical protein